MATMTRKQRAWRSFVRSTYISTVWDWFLGLTGKAAEAVITASVIYSCARLLPGIHPPAGLDATIFIAQMIALDVGGLSLRKLAKRAGRDGNAEGALYAYRVSTALLSIMIANVGLSIVQTIAPISPQAVAVVEGGLLIARAIMAVLYPTAIHALRDDEEPTVSAAQAPADIQALISWSLLGLAAHLQHEAKQHANTQRQAIDTTLAGMEDQLHQVGIDVQNIRSNIQEVQGREPRIDYDAICETVSRNLEIAFQARNETPGETPKGRPMKRVSSRQKKQVKRRSETPESVNDETRIFELLRQDETVSHRELSRITGIPESTAYRLRKKYFQEHSETPEKSVSNGSETSDETAM